MVESDIRLRAQKAGGKKVKVSCMTEDEVQLAMTALQGIFIALNWIEIGCISGDIEGEQSDARGRLILAGKTLVEGITERTMS
jgi:hypothetical protein